MEVALRLEDLFRDKPSIKALMKWREIQNFDDKIRSHLVNHSHLGNKASEHQDNVLRQELEDRQRNIADLKRETDDLTEKKDNLKKEKDELSKKIEKEEMRLDSLEKAVEGNKTNQDKEIKEFKDSCDKNIKDLMRELEKTEQNYKKEISLEINELNKRCNRENDTKECERRASFYDVKRCLSYIAAICLNLQSNLYLYVLPDQYAEDCPYKVKDIEEDIDDEDLLNEEQREEANKKWEELKKELQWEESLKGTLKMLQHERNPWDVPECLEVEEAKKAAEELNKHGRLKGRSSYQRVQKIIQMWAKSVSLVSHHRE